MKEPLEHDPRVASGGESEVRRERRSSGTVYTLRAKPNTDNLDLTLLPANVGLHLVQALTHLYAPAVLQEGYDAEGGYVTTMTSVGPRNGFRMRERDRAHRPLRAALVLRGLDRIPPEALEHLKKAQVRSARLQGLAGDGYRDIAVSKVGQLAHMLASHPPAAERFAAPVPGRRGLRRNLLGPKRLMRFFDELLPVEDPFRDDAFLHGDLHDDNLTWGPRTGVLDFGRWGIGPRSRDLGLYVARGNQLSATDEQWRLQQLLVGAYAPRTVASMSSVHAAVDGWRRYEAVSDMLRLLLRQGGAWTPGSAVPRDAVHKVQAGFAALDLEPPREIAPRLDALRELAVTRPSKAYRLDVEHVKPQQRAHLDALAFGYRLPPEVVAASPRGRAVRRSRAGLPPGLRLGFER